jgi:hypothetical protein
MNTHLIGSVIAMAVLLPFIAPSALAQAQAIAPQAAEPRIERFDLDAPRRLAPGEALIFRISGTSSGDASVRIDGVRGKVALKEVMHGVYEGAYTIKNGDRLTIDSIVIGNLALGSQERSTVLGQPLIQVPLVASTQFVPVRHTFR